MAKQVKIDIVAKDKTKNAISSTKKSLGGLTKFAIAAGVAMAGIAAVKGIKDLARVGKEIESLKIRFGFLFGTVKEGEKAFDNLAKFAAKVPFSLGEISAASGNLAVVAKDAKDLSRILEITGNVAAVTGLDFQTTASQIQRAFSGGIAAADVFREKGVRSLLGFSAGAKVSIEDTVKAFEENFSGDGRFGKATDALAGTLEGTLSMMGDKFMQFQMAINEGFFAEIKKQFGDLNTTLEGNKELWIGWGKNIGEGLATTIGETVETIQLLNAILGATARTVDKATGSTNSLKETFLATNPILLTSIQGFKQLLEFNGPWKDSLNEINPLLADNNRKNIEISNSMMSVAMATDTATESNDALTESIRRGIEADVARFKAKERDGILAKKTAEEAYDAENQLSIDNFKRKERDVLVTKKTAEEEKKAKQSIFEQANKLADAGAVRSKKMFRLQQALNIGQAVMSTYTAAANALRDIPVPFNFAVAGLTIATGMAQVANIRSQQPPAKDGGIRQQGSPFLVGERGPELFTPSNAGTVTPNHQLGSGGATVNFNITTVDAQSFGNLLDTRRGQIVNMINTALNNKGQAALV